VFWKQERRSRLATERRQKHLQLLRQSSPQACLNLPRKRLIDNINCSCSTATLIICIELQNGNQTRSRHPRTCSNFTQTCHITQGKATAPVTINIPLSHIHHSRRMEDPRRSNNMVATSKTMVLHKEDISKITVPLKATIKAASVNRLLKMRHTATVTLLPRRNTASINPMVILVSLDPPNLPHSHF
jgi:hypothetical protein